MTLEHLQGYDVCVYICVYVYMHIHMICILNIYSFRAGYFEISKFLHILGLCVEPHLLKTEASMMSFDKNLNIWVY